MKAIMISIKPKWCALMMNGIKKIEVRRNKALASAIQKLIDENGYADIYVYCTKDKQGIFKERHNGYTLLNQNKWVQSEMNGKVIFKFRCYKVSEWHNYSWQEITKNACLTDDELRDYSKGVASLYCIHISDLEIFDRPKELSEFKILKRAKAMDCFGCDVYQLTEMCIGNRCLLPKPLTKAPQSWCYVEVEE